MRNFWRHNDFTQLLWIKIFKQIAANSFFESGSAKYLKFLWRFIMQPTRDINNTDRNSSIYLSQTSSFAPPGHSLLTRISTYLRSQDWRKWVLAAHPVIVIFAACIFLSGTSLYVLAITYVVLLVSWYLTTILEDKMKVAPPEPQH